MSAAFIKKNYFIACRPVPLLKWLYMVLARRAFLDGQAGLTYAALQAIYEYMIVVKTRELEPGASSGRTDVLKGAGTETKQ